VSSFDIAKRCLTAGCRGALADSGDVNCWWMPLVGRRQGATDDACSDTAGKPADVAGRGASTSRVI
jgi:hypothetical protein